MSGPEPRTAHASPVVVHGALVLVQVAFASLAVFGKIAMRTVPPHGLALARIGGTALVLVTLELVRTGLPRIPRGDLLRLALYSVIGVAGNQILFLSGLSRTTAINAVVLTSTIPVFTVAAGIVLGRERPRPALLAGIVVSLAGVLWLVGVDGFHVGIDTVVGDVMITVNCAGYAVYLVLVRDVIARHGATRVVTVAFAMGTVLALPFGGGALAGALAELDLTTALLVVYIVLVPTTFTYLANAWALRFARASVVAIYIYVQPVVAGVLAVWLLDEEPSARALVAGVAVFAGIALVTEPWRRAAPS